MYRSTEGTEETGGVVNQPVCVPAHRYGPTSQCACRPTGTGRPASVRAGPQVRANQPVCVCGPTQGVDPGYVDPGYVDPGYVDPGCVDPGAWAL